MNAGEPVGRVGAIWRYPVKSMQGERLPRGEFTRAGVVGDRRFAVVDAATGKVASAKNPKKWGDLLACAARFDEAGRLLVALPDGSEVRADEPPVNAALSARLGRAVELRAAHDGGRIEVSWPAVPGLPLAGTATEETLPAGSFHDLARSTYSPPPPSPGWAKHTPPAGSSRDGFDRTCSLRRPMRPGSPKTGGWAGCWPPAGCG